MIFHGLRHSVLYYRYFETAANVAVLKNQLHSVKNLANFHQSKSTLIYWFFVNLHCVRSLAAQCIVIGPVCLCVCESVTTMTLNCVHRPSPNWVCS